MTRSSLLPVLFLLGFAVAACSGGDDDRDSASTRLRVVATTTQIGDFAANIGGDRIDLTVLLKPNQDAHDFELEPSQIRAISQADLVLRNGLGLDDFIDKALEDSDATAVLLSDGIASIETEHGDAEHQGEGEHESGDPHVWFSVDNARHMVEGLRDALIAEDAASGDVYAANAAAYLGELQTLDADIRGQVATVPEPCRKLVTNHEVLGYFAVAYGFEVAGSVIPGTTTGSQASASDVAKIVTLVREQGVPAVFAEASVNPALIEQVGREAGVRVVDDLYGDSLGPKGSDGATYIDMMRANTSKIVSALRECDA